MRDDDNGYLKFQGKRFRAPNEIALLLELIFSRRFAKFIVIDHEKAEPGLVLQLPGHAPKCKFVASTASED